MKTITPFRIDDFLQNNPESEEYIAALFKILQTRDWETFEEIQESFPALESKGKNALFTIGCGRYIVKARINFEFQQVVIRNISEKADYVKAKKST